MTSLRRTLLIGVFAVALTAAPVAAADPCSGRDDIDSFPVGQGNFTTADDVGWIYFRTNAHQACGIGPDGVIGCDDTPYDAPDDANQTIATSSQPASYRRSDTTTFTRDVDILADGHKVENGAAICAVGFQGTVHCDTPGGYGGHGFVIAGAYGILW